MGGDGGSRPTLRLAAGSNVVRGRITLRTIVNLCALQGISIEEMLLDPKMASSRPLIDLWAGYQSFEFPNGSHGAKIAAYRRYIGRMLAKCKGLYLPSMQIALRRMKLNRDLVRELCVDLYEAYEEAYQKQGAYSSRIHAERAFKHALEEFEAPGFNPFAPCDLRKITRRVAVRSNFTLQKSQLITRSALYCRLAFERAKAELMGLPVGEFEGGPWLRRSL